MRYQKHLTSEQLIALFDGELNFFSRFLAKRHLASCEGCQQQASELKSTIRLASIWASPKEGELRRSNDCLDDETVADYVAHQLSQQDRVAVENHLASCDYCLHEVAQLYSTVSRWQAGKLSKVPRQMLQMPVEHIPIRPKRLVWVLSGAVVILLCVFTVLIMQWVKREKGGVLEKPVAVVLGGSANRVRSGEPSVTTRGILQPEEVSLVGFEELAFEYLPQGAKESIPLPLPSDQAVTLVSEKDNFRLVVHPGQDCWLYIFQLDSTSHLIQLFPNSQFTPLTNPVGRSRLFIPSDDRWFYLDKNIGKEQIFIVVSKEQRKDWENLYERYHQSPEGSAQRQQALDALVTTVQSVAETPKPELSGYVFEFNHK